MMGGQDGGDLDAFLAGCGRHFGGLHRIDGSRLFRALINDPADRLSFISLIVPETSVPVCFSWIPKRSDAGG